MRQQPKLANAVPQFFNLWNRGIAPWIGKVGDTANVLSAQTARDRQDGRKTWPRPGGVP